MSSFSGLADERWSLARAVDALAGAARRAGRPGLIWTAGTVYPTVSLALGTAWPGKLLEALGVLPLAHGPAAAGAAVAGASTDVFGSLLLREQGAGILLAPILFLVFRLVAGLARVSSPQAWEEVCGRTGRPRLRDVWRAGRGLTLSALGMWLMLALMILGVVFLFVGPAAGLGRLILGASEGTLEWVVWVVIFGPLVVVMTLYAMVVSVMHQLALHSLAHNRRGVASALIHAWRITRNDPWATARTIVVDLVLYLVILGAVLAVDRVLGPVGTGGLATFLFLCLSGFMGVTRAGYWARAYRALGGLSPDDNVPGLTPSAPAPAAE